MSSGPSLKLNTKFKPGGPINIHVFLKGFELMTRDSPEPVACAKLLNSLDKTAFSTVVASLSGGEGSYKEIKNILEDTYGSPKQLEDKKANFLTISLKKDKLLPEFGRRFRVEAQTLMSINFLTP